MTSRDLAALWRMTAAAIGRSKPTAHSYKKGEIDRLRSCADQLEQSPAEAQVAALTSELAALKARRGDNDVRARAEAWLTSNINVPYGTPEQEAELDAAHHNEAYEIVNAFLAASVSLPPDGIAKLTALSETWKQRGTRLIGGYGAGELQCSQELDALLRDLAPSEAGATALREALNVVKRFQDGTPKTGANMRETAELDAIHGTLAAVAHEIGLLTALPPAAAPAKETTEP